MTRKSRLMVVARKTLVACFGSRNKNLSEGLLMLYASCKVSRSFPEEHGMRGDAQAGLGHAPKLKQGIA